MSRIETDSLGEVEVPESCLLGRPDPTFAGEFRHRRATHAPGGAARAGPGQKAAARVNDRHGDLPADIAR